MSFFMRQGQTVTVKGRRMKEDIRLDETAIASDEIYKSHILRLTRDEVRLPDGNTGIREIVHHNGAVAVIPLDDDGNVVVERQYRYAHGRVLLEIPAGKLESTDEDPLSAARRELREETGITASEWTFLGMYLPSPAIFTEKIYLYLARGLCYGDTERDKDEFMTVEKMKLTALVDAVLRGEVEDGKTQVAALKLSLLLAAGKCGGCV